MIEVLPYIDACMQTLTSIVHAIPIWWVALVHEYQTHPWLGVHMMLVWWMLAQSYRHGPWTWMYHVRRWCNRTYTMPSPGHLWVLDCSIMLLLIWWWNIPIPQSPYLELLRSTATAIEGVRWMIGLFAQRPHDWNWAQQRYRTAHLRNM